MENKDIQHIPLSDSTGFTEMPGMEPGQLVKYVQMCRRYGGAYLEEYSGNTIYHLVLENQTVVFAFFGEAGHVFFSCLYYPKYLRAEAWLHVLEDIERIRRDVHPDIDNITEGDRCFIQNLEKLKKVVCRSLKPFSFIISCLPDECFPQSEQVQIYNDSHVEDVCINEISEIFQVCDGRSRELKGIGNMRNTVLRRVSNRKGSELVLSWSNGTAAKRASALREKIEMLTPDTDMDDIDIMRMTAIESAFKKLWKKI